MEPNPFVVSEWDLKFTHIRIYTYISSDQLKSNSVNRKRERGEREREREREREGGAVDTWQGNEKIIKS